MSPKTMAILGALLAAAGVGLGAYGAHGLEGGSPQRWLRSRSLEAPEAWFGNGREVPALPRPRVSNARGPRDQRSSGELRLASIAFVIGIAVFSGSLYGMTFLGEEWRTRDGHAAWRVGVHRRLDPWSPSPPGGEVEPVAIFP